MFEPVKDWFDAFQQLMDLIELSDKEKKIIFLDELPWLDTPQSGFLSALEHFWNSWASARQYIILVACGSSASWIIHKINNNKGGLHNRITKRIKLEPFSLAETEVFLHKKNSALTRYQIVQLYMVLGGIPYYLDMVDAGQSAVQNINRLCFEADGELRDEFGNLYTSLFKNADRHMAVIEALSVKSSGLGRDGIINLCEIKISINEYIIDKQYADDLRKKVEVFRTQSKTKKALFLTMITAFGLQNNAHAQTCVQNSLVLDNLFVAI